MDPAGQPSCSCATSFSSRHLHPPWFRLTQHSRLFHFCFSKCFPLFLLGSTFPCTGVPGEDCENKQISSPTTLTPFTKGFLWCALPRETVRHKDGNTVKLLTTLITVPPEAPCPTNPPAFQNNIICGALCQGSSEILVSSELYPDSTNCNNKYTGRAKLRFLD